MSGKLRFLTCPKCGTKSKGGIHTCRSKKTPPSENDATRRWTCQEVTNAVGYPWKKHFEVRDEFNNVQASSLVERDAVSRACMIARDNQENIRVVRLEPESEKMGDSDDRPPISFMFEGKRYDAPYSFYETDRFQLPDGRVIKAGGWLDCYPPELDDFVVEEPVTTNRREILFTMSDVVRLKILEQLRIQYEKSEFSDRELRDALEICMCVLTEPMAEHPDGWEYPCLCELCKSYA